MLKLTVNDPVPSTTSAPIRIAGATPSLLTVMPWVAVCPACVVSVAMIGLTPGTSGTVT